MGWRIKSWDPVRAQGVIASGLGELPFDAAVAMCDHFDVGEAVEVLLARVGENYRVTKVAPEAWHPPRAPAPEHGDADVREAIERVLLDESVETCTVSFTPNGPVIVDVVMWDRVRRPRIELRGAWFLQMPLEGKYVRVSSFPMTPFLETEVAAHWPAPPSPDGWWVYRFEPEWFDGQAGYVIAQSIALVGV